MLNRDAGQTQDRPTSTTQGLRVLIVDDNRSFTDLLASALETVEGITCVGTASSAAECYLRVAELRPSVVVMDIMMPGLDGLAATTTLRQISPDTAIVVASAHSQNEWIARAEDAGASAYIPKGGSLADMIQVLRAARPGPMIVAPSLEAAWSSWEPPAPDPATAPGHSSVLLNQLDCALGEGSPALGGPFSRLRLKGRRAKRHVARGLTAASQARGAKPFRA